MEDFCKEICFANFVFSIFAPTLLVIRRTSQSRRGEVSKVKTSKSAIKIKKPWKCWRWSLRSWAVSSAGMLPSALTTAAAVVVAGLPFNWRRPCLLAACRCVASASLDRRRRAWALAAGAALLREGYPLKSQRDSSFSLMRAFCLSLTLSTSSER